MSRSAVAVADADAVDVADAGGIVEMCSVSLV